VVGIVPKNPVKGFQGTGRERRPPPSILELLQITGRKGREAPTFHLRVDMFRYFSIPSWRICQHASVEALEEDLWRVGLRSAL
jgi:hypothetical protein